MARYRKYKKYRKYRKYYKRYKKSIKPVNNSSRSRCTIKSKALLTFPIEIAAGDTDSEVWAFNPFVVHLSPLNVPRTLPVYYGGTLDQPIVKTYCALYDEFKVDAVVSRITLTTPIGMGASIDALRVYSAWDRKGTYADTYYQAKYPTITDLERMPSAQVAIVSNNTVNTMYRYCKASDFFEKYCFVDSTCGQFAGKVRIDDTYSDWQQYWLSEAWLDADNHFIGFSPTLYLGLQCVNYTPLNKLTINIAMEITTYYSFRNPRYGATGDSTVTKVGAPLPSSSINPNRISGYDDVDMVDRAILDAPSPHDPNDEILNYAPGNKRVRIVDPEVPTPPPEPAAQAAADTAGENYLPVSPAPLPPNSSFVPASEQVEKAVEGKGNRFVKTLTTGAAILGGDAATRNRIPDRYGRLVGYTLGALAGVNEYNRVRGPHNPIV